MKTSNPALRAFNKVQVDEGTSPMTIEGTINKSLFLLTLTIIAAMINWNLSADGNSLSGVLTMVGFIGGFILALIGIFATRTINIIAPLYALFEGLALGGVSYMFNTLYIGIAETGIGIVPQAIIITFLVFALMLTLYKFRILQATPVFTKVVILATASIAVFYVASIVLSFFHIDISVFNMGAFGIVVQLIIVAVASLNFILDFSFIEQASEQGYPAKMEWYGAFSLMITLIWLYLEILRLLALTGSKR